MKKALFILTLLSLIQLPSFASHILGGEITWECQANGQFIFKMVVYRDCQGSGLPGGTQTLAVYDNPGLTSISLPNFTSTDITYCQPAYNCLMGLPPVGATEKGIYTSDPVTLSGVPPASGWTFAWSTCCNNGAIENTSVFGVTLRTTMYPFNGQDENPCFDSSPSFAEQPFSVLCSSKDFIYNYQAFDRDLDSLHFEWGQVLEQPVSSPPASWIPGSNPPYGLYNNPYTYLNPFPSSAPNIGGTIDGANGEIKFTSFINGKFLSCVKVSAYKCGVVVSETYRDMQFVTKNCFGANNNPSITPPFQDSLGNYTILSDTVSAGDLVSFSLIASDFDIDSGIPQSVTLTAFGAQFGTNFTDTASGCLVPPCAVIVQPMPATQIISDTVNINWQTTADHLGMQYPCAYMPNTYYFSFKASDSRCPEPALDYKTVAITVLPTYPRPVIQDSSSILYCLDSGFNYQWYLNRFKVNGATQQSYTPVEAGNYQVRITDSLNSGNYSNEIYIFSLTNINSQPSGLEFTSLFPNPAGEFIEIRFTENFMHDITLSLYDMMGRRVFSSLMPGSKGNMEFHIPLLHIRSGVYTFEIGNGVEIIRKKVVVAKN